MNLLTVLIDLFMNYYDLVFQNIEGILGGTYFHSQVIWFWYYGTIVLWWWLIHFYTHPFWLTKTHPLRNIFSCQTHPLRIIFKNWPVEKHFVMNKGPVNYYVRGGWSIFSGKLFGGPPQVLYYNSPFLALFLTKFFAPPPTKYSSPPDIVNNHSLMRVLE